MELSNVELVSDGIGVQEELVSDERGKKIYSAEWLLCQAMARLLIGANG